MLIVEDYYGCFDDPLEKYYQFENYSKDDDGKVLFHGMGCIEKPNYKELYKGYDKKAFWNLEQPCAWYGNVEYMRKSANTDDYFNKIITNCPYSGPWLNELQGRNTFVFLDSHLPFNENHIVDKKEEKVHDVLYWGGVHHQDHMDFLDSMSGFNYNFLSLGPAYWAREFVHSGYDKYITATSLPRVKMWELLRKTKICLMSNMLYLRPSQVATIKAIDGWEKCEAFSHLHEARLPQIKCRMIESAVNRCLMVVKNNPWKVDEFSFEAGKDFIYFNKNEELPALIDDISRNWHKYEDIVESAFQKASTKYTVKNFLAEVEKELDD